MSDKDDCISKKMAIDTIMGQPPEPHYPSWYAAQIEKLPAVQPATNCSEIPNGSDDTISRRAAIEVLSLGKEILSRVLDDIDVVGTDREKYSWGLGLIESNIEDIKDLPSAQPEIVRCKDCKNSEHWYGDRRRCFLWVEEGISVFNDGFCNYAERRADE